MNLTSPSIFSLFCLATWSLLTVWEPLFLLEQCFHISIIWGALKSLFSRMHIWPINSEYLGMGARHWHFKNSPVIPFSPLGIFFFGGGGASNVFRSKIILEYIRTRPAFSWWYPWICSKSRLASFSALATISGNELEVRLTADEDMLGSQPHQVKATNAQHKCILKEGTHCIGAEFSLRSYDINNTHC